MASKLTKWINAQLKSKGKSSKEAQKDAGKYSSIAAAKRAGSLYYTDKKGRVMIAAYAEDLKDPIKPIKRPEVKTKKPTSKTPDESSGGKAKSKVKKAPPGRNVQLKQKGDGSKGSKVVEAGDRYRKPGQGSGRGLRGTNPEERFSGKIKQKKKKK